MLSNEAESVLMGSVIEAVYFQPVTLMSRYDFSPALTTSESTSPFPPFAQLRCTQ